MDRSPIASLVGRLSAWEGVELRPILADGTDRVVSEAHVQLTDVASGPVTVEFGNDVAGSGEAFQVTIATGEREGVASASLALSPTQDLHQRVIAGSDGLNLSGYVGVSATQPALVGQYLTTLERVKREERIEVNDHDQILLDWIVGVSEGLERAVGRMIVPSVYSAKMDGPVDSDRLALWQHVSDPATLVVSEGGTALVRDTDYELDSEQHGLYRLSGQWLRGRRNIEVSFTAGWSPIPADLAGAATEEVRHRYQQTVPGGGRLALESVSREAGGSTGYVQQEWLPATQAVINHWHAKLRWAV